MTLAIMQPYLFPYIGYWQLINAVDTFVVYDNIQFTKKGWFHRNNILLNNKRTLFSIPLKKDSDYLNVIDRYLSDESEKEIQKILSQITASYKKAPYYEQVYPLISEILLYKEKNLFKYIFNSIKRVCEYLNIKTKIIISSTIDIDHSLKSQDKVIAINEVLNSNRYLNSIGGMELYDMQSFDKKGIELLFLDSDIPQYSQFSEVYIPYLSIIDVMMFNDEKKILKMLESYQVINPGDINV